MVFLPPSAGFLALADASQKDRRGHRDQALVIPFGLEASVTYGHGTSQGPQAIIDASREVETFDCELWLEPCDHFSLLTLAPEPIPQDIPTALNTLENRVEQALTANFFPLILGGEHALTPGAIRPLVKRHPDLVILHFDAHADLRDGYLGQHHSHASAMRRCLDHPGVQLVSVGIRNISRSEAEFFQSQRERIHIFWAHEKNNGWPDRILALIRNRKVYLSFDVDALDSSLMPATGTPEPGGLFWDDCMPILRMAMKHAQVVGADITELAPLPQLRACDFLTAKLAYKMLSYRFADRGSG
ncbi:MAG: Agmatinase [Magnetococcales bacterium]|nr:Agmatinase [Magnetococcales bacterium]HIJ83959.1 agmatinase [Magnetococcales bacterium]